MLYEDIMINVESEEINKAAMEVVNVLAENGISIMLMRNVFNKAEKQIIEQEIKKIDINPSL